MPEIFENFRKFHGMIATSPLKLGGGGDGMKETEHIRDFPVLRLDPELRLCPQFDSESIALFPVATREEMGFRVLDNFCEEHIQ